MTLQQSILIIEDERLEQELLAAQVRELLHGRFQVLVSNNGIQALQMCQEYCPSILLVDINMPGLNGLELIRTLREFSYPGRIIITTAYDLFAYAKEAIAMGVDAYLLKPIDDTELHSALQSCLSSMERDAKKMMEIKSAFSYAEAYLAHDLLSGKIPANALKEAFSWPNDGSLQARILQLRCLPCTEEAWQTHFITRCRALYAQRYLLLTAKVKQDIVVFVQPRNPEEPAFIDAENYFNCRQILREIPEDKAAFLSATKVHAAFQDLLRSFHESPAQRNGQYMPSQRLCVRLPDYSALCLPKNRNKTCQKWLQKFREGNPVQMVSMLSRSMDEKERYWPGVLLFLEMLERMDPGIVLEEVFQIFCSDDPFNQLERWMRCYLESPGCAVQTSRSRQDDTAGRVMEQLEQRFSDPDLTEKLLAEEFGFSQEHFSRMIKKEFGQSFVALMTSLRLEHAKKLLLDESLSLEDISQRCGYQNRKYFFRVFKKHTGRTPAEYRKQRVDEKGGTPV